MKHQALTLLIMEFNHLLDTGRYDDISVDEIRSRIDDGTILDFIEQRAGRDLMLGPQLCSVFPDFRSLYVKYLQSIHDAYAGDENAKWGIERKGICLLIGWTAEILQQGSGWTRNTNVALR